VNVLLSCFSQHPSLSKCLLARFNFLFEQR